jgi:hypothetical protein
MTCGRGRGFGFATDAGEVGVMSVIYSVLAADQCCHFRSFCLSMILSENRFQVSRIML